MLEDSAVRLLIRAKLADGRLPQGRSERVWGGYGTGETCAACEESISKDQLAMESPRLTGGVMAFHVKCFAVWDDERTSPRDPN
jgi:hypothetical protein